ncbi:MAG TPA: hypothetical protein VE953_02620 [Terriglobales bacterium]|nr:hypothetical protein [Terriglobales bacterium]
MRIWARGGGALLTAAAAGTLAWSLLSAMLPAPATTPRPGAVLETVTPAQLAAMGVRLDPTLQPVQLPDWMSGLGVRMPTGIKLGDDAESAVRRSSGGVRSVTERVLAYATVSNTRNARLRGPTIVRRLVWALVGTRAAAGSVGGLVQVLWLVDARSGHQLAELTVLAATPIGPSSGAGP